MDSDEYPVVFGSVDPEYRQEISTNCLKLESSGPPWSDLAALILERIYLCLGRGDRGRMSVICKNWSREYSTPSLWRNMKFVLDGRVPLEERYPEVKFAWKYGSLFHHVEIHIVNFDIQVFRDPIMNPYEPIRKSVAFEEGWEQLHLFLQALTLHPQMLSLSFVGMYLESYYRLGLVHSERIVEVILKLLSQTTRLESLEFKYCLFDRENAEEVFRGISARSSSTLKSLKLEDVMWFVVNKIDAASTYNLLTNLRELFISYTRFFEKIVLSCFEYVTSQDVLEKESNLERICIEFSGFDSDNYRGISPEAWRCLRQRWPKLKINVTFRGKGTNISLMPVVIVQDMPVTSFNFTKDISDPSEPEIGFILQHLVSCNINTYLEELNINDITGSSIISTEDLAWFIQQCPRLRSPGTPVKTP